MKGETKLELLSVQETRDLLILELHYIRPPELAAAIQREPWSLLINVTCLRTPLLILHLLR